MDNFKFGRGISQLEPKWGYGVIDVVGETNYNRREVIDIIDRVLQYPDYVMDAVTNENTDWGAERLFNLVN